MSSEKKICLTVAGSDSSGGAGIQADIKTITAHGVYAASVITALTAQNTTGVQAIHAVPSGFIQAQCHSVFSDLAVDAVKIGMLHDVESVQVIAAMLKQFKPKYTVIDPVMIAQSGDSLIQPGLVSALTGLLPLATLITPNLYEAEQLAGVKIDSEQTQQQAALQLAEQYKVAVLVKGGHHAGPTAADVLCSAPSLTYQWFKSPIVVTSNNHGTGCTLSSAIACQLATGLPLSAAVQEAKKYISTLLMAGCSDHWGKGHGPLFHAESLVAISSA